MILLHYDNHIYTQFCLSFEDEEDGNDDGRNEYMRKKRNGNVSEEYKLANWSSAEVGISRPSSTAGDDRAVDTLSGHLPARTRFDQR